MADATVFVVSDDAVARNSRVMFIASAGLRAETFSSISAWSQASPARPSGCLVLEAQLRPPLRSGTRGIHCVCADPVNDHRGSTLATRIRTALHEGVQFVTDGLARFTAGGAVAARHGAMIVPTGSRVTWRISNASTPSLLLAERLSLVPVITPIPRAPDTLPRRRASLSNRHSKLRTLLDSPLWICVSAS
jgi:hypothetical protein